MTTQFVRMRALRFLLVVLTLALLVLIPSGNSTAASISLVISNPLCEQPKADSSTCYIKMRSATAYGSDTSFSNLQVFIDGKLRLNMQGFFESNAYFTEEMLSRGLAVSCGRPNDGGDPNFGKNYTVLVKAAMYDGANTWGSAQVRCPYYDGKVYLPSVRR